MEEKRYPSDLSDQAWALVLPFLETDFSKGGRPYKYPRREILNALFYVLKTGCQWRYLPKNFPHWKTVYLQYRRWLNSGVIERIYDALHQRERIRQNKDPLPSAAIADSQSVKSTEKGALEVMMVVKKLRDAKGI